MQENNQGLRQDYWIGHTGQPLLAGGSDFLFQVEGAELILCGVQSWATGFLGAETSRSLQTSCL